MKKEKEMVIKIQQLKKLIQKNLKTMVSKQLTLPK